MNSAGMFAFIWDGYQGTLSTGASQAITSGLSAVAGMMLAIGTAYILVCGFLILWGELGWTTGVRMVVRMIVVVAVLTPARFNTYVRAVFMDWLPNWIATSITGDTGTNAAAQQFDMLVSATEHYTAALLMQASGLENVGTRIQINLAQTGIELTLLIAFVVWFSARALMALVVCIGPFVIAAWLFNTTREVFARWLGKLIGLSILLLLVSIELQIVVHQDTEYMLAAQANAAGGLDEQVAGLLHILIAFGAGAALMIVLPAIAAVIGGGVGLSPVPSILRLGRLLAR